MTGCVEAFHLNEEANLGDLLLVCIRHLVFMLAPGIFFALIFKYAQMTRHLRGVQDTNPVATLVLATMLLVHGCFWHALFRFPHLIPKVCLPRGGKSSSHGYGFDLLRLNFHSNITKEIRSAAPKFPQISRFLETTRPIFKLF